MARASRRDSAQERPRSFPVVMGLMLALLGMACAGIQPYPRFPSRGVRPGGPTGQDRIRVDRIIESYLGTPYTCAGESLDGVDCSGFVTAVYREALGVALPHNTEELYHIGEEVDQEELRFGDLVFFAEKRGRVSHVGISLGKSQFVHASREQGVTISNLNAPYFRTRYIGARRILQ